MRNLLIIIFLSATVAAQSTTKSAPTAKAPATAPTEPTAVITTSVGTMTCTLFPNKAPLGVANFIGLATGKKDWKSPVTGATKHGVPLYDATIFHRVIPNFMIQGGDPKGDGSGGPGYDFKNEVSSDLLFDKPGRLAYANSGADTNGSQFFITEKAFEEPQASALNGHYTIFGQCDDATVELVKQVARMATDPSNDRPFRPVKIVHISILKGGATAAKPGAPAHRPAASTPSNPK